MLEMARKSLVGKAIARPDLVKQVIAKIKAEGVAGAYRASIARLDNPVPLGYSCAGVVMDVGEGLQDFKDGGRHLFLARFFSQETYEVNEMNEPSKIEEIN
jgi:Zn-dependent alcohol dehydrogenase